MFFVLFCFGTQITRYALNFSLKSVNIYFLDINAYENTPKSKRKNA